MKSTGLRYYIDERKNKQELRELRTEKLIADFLGFLNSSVNPNERIELLDSQKQLIKEYYATDSESKITSEEVARAFNSCQSGGASRL